MRKTSETEMRTVAGGAKIKCAWCGRKYSNNAIAKALHWVVYGCWGY